MIFTANFKIYISGIQISRGLFAISAVFIYSSLCAQQTQIYKPNVNRILFVLDGSGSMKQKWNDRTKFENAKDLLTKIIDSVEQKNPNVEFAVRVFGYQFSREQKNCKDSKLLIPFAKNNAAKINSVLKSISPQGMSPVAYSIQLGAKDFPEDVKSLNSIILITDGEENCEGDPCSISQALIAKRITLKPFIVGLNVDSAKHDKFRCMGTFYDTQDETSFYNTVGVIIKQTLNTTSTQINLLDPTGNPTVTNVAFTLYDHNSGKIQYNFIHTMNEKGNPDTLYLDPVGIYDLELHTYPSVRKENIELIPGKHNIIAVDVPAGDLKVECVGASIANNNAQVLLRSKRDLKNVLNVQDLNEEEKYLSSDYHLEILTTPEIYVDTFLVPFAENKISVPNYGTLSIIAPENISASIFTTNSGVMQLVSQFETTMKADNRKLQPGEYSIVYKSKSSYDSESTKSLNFLIEEGRVSVINLQ
ncbi:MAG: VWA domain-containing protein [Bacteroidota bacterium]